MDNLMLLTNICVDECLLIKIDELKRKEDECRALKEDIKKLELLKNDHSIYNVLNEFNKTERQHIEQEKNNTSNVSKTFKGIGDFGEELTIELFPKSIGSGSKGGVAFDNVELNKDGSIEIAREVKTCCPIQSKQCRNKKCRRKAPFFQLECVFCGNTEFKIIRDTRFGIDTKSHFKYEKILKEYIFNHIDYDEITEKIYLKTFKINSDNHYFRNYLKNQYENSSKSNTCNLLPYSYDFHLSGPILLLDCEMSPDNINIKYFNIHNKNIIDIPTNIFTKREKMTLEIETEKYINYEKYISKLSLRNKNLNKDRGFTMRQ